MIKLPAAVILLLVGLISGCQEEIEPGRTPIEAERAGQIELGMVTEGTLSEARSFVGSVESPDRGLLSARIDGRIARIAVSEGDEVAKGDLLITIDDNVARGRYEEARAAVAQAEGAREQALAELSLTEKTYMRYRQLFEKEALTRQEMDRITAEREVARQAVRAAEASVQRALSGLEVARIGLSHTRIEAPYDARVVRKEVEEGSTVMPGAPLIVLDRKGAWRVRAELPESLTGDISVGDALRVEIPALGRMLPAEVAEILPASDPRSRSFQIKVALKSQAPLKAGLFAKVYPRASEEVTLLVPKTAVVTRGQLSSVFVVDQDRLRLRMVKVGRITDTEAEILSGLTPGEQIVVKGAVHARSGQRVGE